MEVRGQLSLEYPIHGLVKRIKRKKLSDYIDIYHTEIDMNKK